MRTFRFALAGTAVLTLLTAPLGAQERTILSKEVAVSQAEASLAVEFEDQERLTIALREGSLFIDGEVAGAYEPGDELDAAFRALVGRAVALENGPLGDMLMEWSPPDDLPEDRLTLARRIDESLESALTAPAAAVGEEGPRIRVEGDDESRLLSALLGEAGRLGFLEEALSGLDQIRIHVQEDVTVGEGETVDASLLVVDADARVAGVVTRDVVVVDGTVELLETGEIQGDVRLADAEFLRSGGRLLGEVRQLTDEDGVSSMGDRDVRDLRELRDEIRSEVRDELRRELRSELRHDSGDSGLASGIFAPFRGLFRAIGGILENLVGVFLMGLAGMGIIAFAPRNLDAVAETARRAPGRAAAVGMAGTFLLLPVYVLGMVALAISIVGIPVLIAWIPLFPLAALAAAIMGYVAVARNVGEWLSESDYRYTDWIRRSNAVYTIFGGLLGLAAFCLAAEALHVVPFTGFFRGLLTFAGAIVVFSAAMVGFGSVLLTRAGRRPEYYPMDPEEAWRQAVDPDLEPDLDETDSEPRDPTDPAGRGTSDPEGDRA